jgi:DNA mismatch repair protein MutS2
LSNSLQVLIHWKLLKPPERPNNPTAQILRKSTQFNMSLAHDQDRTLDLRGETVDDALLNLERELDIAMQRGEDRMRVIHGHGTEALKRSVRAYLSRSLYVKKWKAGTPETGGDGITWVEIGKD